MRRRQRDQRGAAAVEFALVLLPLLLPVLAGLVDFGSAIVVRAQMQEATQEAASMSARYPDDPVAAKDRAKSIVTAVQLTDADITITCPSTDTTDGALVTIRRTQPTVLLKVFLAHDLELTTSMTAGRLSTKACTSWSAP